MDLNEKIKKLPSSPGVYLMKDSDGSIIYVGKSKSLKNRVSSYFMNLKSHSPKVVKLVKNLKDFDYILTDTEFEAFLLECKLIKELKPAYNRLMKNPKAYSYIKININEKYPSLELCNESSNDDGSTYFGPYASSSTVERGIEGIKECCKISCTGTSRNASSCLNYSLGLCIGMCCDSVSREQYMSIIDKIINLLSGTDKGILYEIENKMKSASEKLDFESAVKYRDYLSAVNSLINRTKIVNYTEENKNIALLENINNESIKFFLIKGNKILFSEKYSLSNSKELKSVLKSEAIYYFNKSLKNPIEIGKDEIDETLIIYSYLKNKSNDCKYFVVPDEWLDPSKNAYFNGAIDDLLKNGDGS